MAVLFNIWRNLSFCHTDKIKDEMLFFCLFALFLNFVVYLHFLGRGQAYKALDRFHGVFISHWIVSTWKKRKWTCSSAMEIVILFNWTCEHGHCFITLILNYFLSICLSVWMSVYLSWSGRQADTQQHIHVKSVIRRYCCYCFSGISEFFIKKKNSAIKAEQKVMKQECRSRRETLMLLLANFTIFSLPHTCNLVMIWSIC